MSENFMTPRAFLATEIERARVALEMTYVELGAALNVSDGTVRSWVKGRHTPHPHDLERLEKLHIPQNVLSRFREKLVKTASPVEWFGKWPVIEGQSTSLWSHELFVIPGLLQTEEYALEIFRAAQIQGDVKQMAADRIKRQEILDSDVAPNLVVVLSENALLNNVGGPGTMYRQLARLAEEARNGRALVHVIRARSRGCAGFSGPFVIADYTDKGEARTAVYLDNARNGEITDDYDDIVRQRRVFDTLRAHSLNLEDSVELILGKAEEWKS